MEFEWDEAKNKETLARRGFDLRYATRLFAQPRLEEVDRRYDYGELRIIATGRVNGDLLTVVYTRRQGRYRIISARPANRRERHAYRAAYP